MTLQVQRHERRNITKAPAQHLSSESVESTNQFFPNLNPFTPATSSQKKNKNSMDIYGYSLILDDLRSVSM